MIIKIIKEYENSSPPDRNAKNFQINSPRPSKWTMSNWRIRSRKDVQQVSMHCEDLPLVGKRGDNQYSQKNTGKCRNLQHHGDNLDE